MKNFYNSDSCALDTSHGLAGVRNCIKQIREQFPDSKAVNKMLQDILVKSYVEQQLLSPRENQSVRRYKSAVAFHESWSVWSGVLVKNRAVRA